MNKQNNIRKKALDYAKKREWDKALEEFSRLVEIEQHNPNLFNEIGDIHLKLGDKREAFKRYHEAIDAYAKVGLLNNAVAVCKKILRLNPNDSVVFGRMATLRQRQGFGREAVSYALEYLDKILRSRDPAGEGHQTLVLEIAEINREAPEVLERAADYLISADAINEAGGVLTKLEQLYHKLGMAAERQGVQQKIKTIGYVAPSGSEPSPQVSKPEVTEMRDAAEAQSKPSGASPAERDVPFRGTTPSHIRREREGDGATDFGVIDVDGANTRDHAKPSEAPRSPETHAHPNPLQARAGREFDAEPTLVDKEGVAASRARRSSAPVNASAVEDAPVEAKEYVIRAEDSDAGESDEFGEEQVEGEATGDSTDVFTEGAREVRADVDDGDYSSHYDLGMAYLEMNLLTEAIREFQFAASSPSYQLRSLEMIGRCFINQNQPKLAIKQLSKGLSMVEGDDRAALGIKYSLGLAYEMVGEIEKAKALFEDVYVIDVTFREVEQKMKKYPS